MRKTAMPARRRGAAKIDSRKNPRATWKQTLLHAHRTERPNRRPTGDAPQYQAILEDYAEYCRVADRTSFEVDAGIRSPRENDPTPPEFDHLFAPRTIKFLQRLAEKSLGRAAQERANRTYWALLDERLGRQTAGLSQRLDAAGAEGRIEINGRLVPFYRHQAILSRTRSADRREKIWQSVSRFVDRKLNPLLAAKNRADYRQLRRHGFTGRRQFEEGWTGINYEDLMRLTQNVAANTEARYLEAMRRVARERLNRGFPGLAQAHVPFFRDDRDFDRFFPKQRLRLVGEMTFRRLGLDFSAHPNIRIDLADRPTKKDCSLAWSINAPEKVGFIVAPRGGVKDYENFLHEAGHAWLDALTDPDLPYELRALPRSSALTETFAALFESLTWDEGWLTEMAGLPPSAAAELAARRRLADLYVFRRHVGLLTCLIEFDRRPNDDLRNCGLYRSVMTAFTGFDCDGAMFLLDTDDQFFLADYLRAYLAQAHLQLRLVERHGERWFASTAAGDFLKSLLSRGASLEAEDLSRLLGFEPWDAAPLLRQFGNV